jgi:hypothetical protein
MKKQLFSFLLIISFVFSVSAQTKEARKIDELINYDCDDMLARLDRLASQTMKDSKAKAFIIIYEGRYSLNVSNKGENEKRIFLPRFGESVVRTQIMQNHLLNFRNLPREKILFVSGGFRENHTVELWVVPNGANPPKPTPTLENMKYRKGNPVNVCESIM